MRIYATTADLSKWLDSTAPVNSAALLRSATSVVRHETRFARYRTGQDGLPVDQTVTEALRDAVCAQVAFWLALEYDPLLGALGMDPIVTGESVPGASVSYLVDKNAVDRHVNIGDTLAPMARVVLSEAKLLKGSVRLL